MVGHDDDEEDDEESEINEDEYKIIFERIISWRAAGDSFMDKIARIYFVEGVREIR